jgi:hypothetical protein
LADTVAQAHGKTAQKGPQSGVKDIRKQFERLCEEEKRRQVDELIEARRPLSRTAKERQLRTEAFGMAYPYQARPNQQLFEKFSHQRASGVAAGKTVSW